MANKRNLSYFMAGSGLGNVSRFEAIYEELSESDFKFQVFCWGKSYSYLNKSLAAAPQIELVRLKDYVLPTKAGRLGLGKFFLLFPVFLFNFISNSLIIFRETLKHRPCLSVHDSDYHFFPLILLQVPRVFIGQAAMIVSNRAYLHKCGLKAKLNFYLYEVSELLLTTLLTNKVFCPSFSQNTRSLFAKIEVISPIVRRPFRAQRSEQGHGVALFSGGSGIQSEALLSFARINNLKSYISKNDETYSAFDSHAKPLIANYRGVIAQAGHVLISECLSMGLRIMPIAIEDHPEQIVNAAILKEEFGFNYELSREGVNKLLADSNSKHAERLKCSGALEVAKYILMRAKRVM